MVWMDGSMVFAIRTTVGVTVVTSASVTREDAAVM